MLFVAFIATPSIVTLCNHDADVSIFYSMNEEENKNGIEIEKEIKFEEHSLIDFSGILFGEKSTSNYGYLMNFSDWHSETISPPPEA